MESTDKGGNFIGWLYVDNQNLSIALVEAGLSKVHFTAERSSHYHKLLAAEEKAKAAKLKVGLLTLGKMYTPLISGIEGKFAVFGSQKYLQHHGQACSLFQLASLTVLGLLPCRFACMSALW